MSVVERTIDRLRQAGGPKKDSSLLPVPSAQNKAIGSSQPSSDVSERRIAIDRDGLRAAGYLPESNQDRVFADEYRQIKRPLIATAFEAVSEEGGDRRVIMMGSALPGDGKTFTSINLALSLAREKDTSVVLIDADVAKPHVSQIFGVSQEPGLLDFLSDESLNLGQLVLRTDVRGLSILPAGSQGELATELLASERMGVLVSKLLEDNPRRLVLLDSSPLLVSSESRAVAAVAGQIVLVVRAGKTPRQAVLDALAEVQETKTISLVLNQGRRGLIGGDYGYGSYGTYGQQTDAA